jgi:hypothetical protein
MLSRYRQRIINCFNRVRRTISGQGDTRGEQDNNDRVIEDDLSIRDIAKEHCKKVEKTYDDTMLGLIHVKDNDDTDIFEIGVYDKDECDINCLICLDKIDYTKDIRFIQGCCRQVYHIECIHKWVLDNHTCPTCKDTLLIYKC